MYTRKLQATEATTFDYTTPATGEYTWRMRSSSIGTTTTQPLTYSLDNLSIFYTYPYTVENCDNLADGYRFGFNTQEKDDEVYGAGNLNTAEFWEYDTRLGRRWNLDPKFEFGISEYSVMNGNPILRTDVKGDNPGIAIAVVEAGIVTGAFVYAFYKTTEELKKVDWNQIYQETKDNVKKSNEYIIRKVEELKPKNSPANPPNDNNGNKNQRTTQQNSNKPNEQGRREVVTPNETQKPQVLEAKPSRKSGKEKGSDIPDWAKGTKPKEGQTPNEYASELLNDKYGEGNWKSGPGSEHNKLKKHGERSKKK